MRPALIVPWRPDPHRQAIWDRLKARHLAEGREVVEGACEGEWCKAAAITDALERTDGDLLVLHDADVWCDGLNEAVDAVQNGCRWAIPHRMLYRLAEGVTEPTTQRSQLAQMPYEGFAGGGIVVIDRDAYETCPMDPRFVGWGHEDESFALALTVMFGAPWRGDADLWHWWHPPQERPSVAFGSPGNQELGRRYRQAAGVASGRHVDPDRRAMEALIEEARGGHA